MIRGENKAPTTGEIKRELTCPIPFEWVRISRHQLGDPAYRFQVAQPSPKFARADRPEFFLSNGLFFTQLTEFLVSKVDFQGSPSLYVFT